MKHQNSLSAFHDLVGSNLSSPVRLYGSPSRKKQVVPYSPRSPNKYNSFFSPSSKINKTYSISEKSRNIHFSPTKNRTISRREFNSMLENPKPQDFKDSFLGQALFDLSIGLRSLNNVLKLLLNFRLNAPLKFYSYSSLLNLINASSLCPPDAVLQLLTIAKVMITKHNYAKPKYLHALIKVTKYLIRKKFYYVSYGKNMQDKPKRKLERLLRIFTDYLDIPPIGLEGKYETSMIEDIMNEKKSLNEEKLEKDIQRRKRNRQLKEKELKENNKFISESDDYENDRTEITGDFSIDSDIFNSQNDKIINSFNFADNEDTYKDHKNSDHHEIEKIDDNMNIEKERDDINKEDDKNATPKNNADLLPKAIDNKESSPENNKDNDNLLEKEDINTAENNSDQNLIQKDDEDENKIDIIDSTTEKQKDLEKEKNSDDLTGDDIEENLLKRDENISEFHESSINNKNDNNKGKDDIGLLPVNDNFSDTKDAENDNNILDSDTLNTLIESENGNSNADELLNLLVESDNDNSDDDLDNLLMENDNGNSATDNESDNLLKENDNNSTEDNEFDRKSQKDKYVDTNSQTDNFDKYIDSKSQHENYVDEKSQTENDNDVYDDNFPSIKSHNNEFNNFEHRSNFEDYDRMSSRSWKSSLAESVQFCIDIEPENNSQIAEQNIQLRQLEDSDPNIRSIERFIMSTDTIYERREKGMQRIENITPEQRAQIDSLVKLFNNWKTAYASSRVVWNTMKADPKFDINILLSQIPVSYGDFLIEALTTFAEQEGIIIQKIVSPK